MRSHTWKILMVIVALAAVVIVVPNTNSFIILLVTRALAFSILVMSLDILLGYTASLRSARPPISASAPMRRRSSRRNIISGWAGTSGWCC